MSARILVIVGELIRLRHPPMTFNENESSRSGCTPTTLALHSNLPFLNLTVKGIAPLPVVSSIQV